MQLRWDKADEISYHTCQKLLPLIEVLDNMLLVCDSGVVPADNVYGCIDAVYASIVSTLCSVADTYIPRCRKGFFKFWWNEDLSLEEVGKLEHGKAQDIDTYRDMIREIDIRIQDLKIRYSTRVRCKYVVSLIFLT